MSDHNDNHFAKDNTSLLLSKKTKEFEAQNYVTAERQRHLAFGSILMYMFGESSRVFNVSNRIPLNDLLNLLHDYKIDHSEDAHQMIKRLSHSSYFTSVAKEIYTYFIEPGKLMPVSLGDLPDSIEGLQSSWEISLQETIPTMEQYAQSNPGADQEDVTFIWHVYAQKFMVQIINRCLNAYKENMRFFDNHNVFNAQDLDNIKDFSAYDLGRVAYICKINVHLGYLEEEEAWEHIELAAKTASERYDSWRQYFSAYIMGRALSVGKSSTDLEHAIKFLLEHPESPIRPFSFK